MEASDAQPRSPLFRFAGWWAGLAAFALAAATLDELGVVWDEPFFWQKHAKIEAWTRQILGGGEAAQQALTADALKQAWPYCVATPDENPPVYAIGGAATGWAFRDLIGERSARRLWSALCFSAVAGGVFGVAASRWGLRAGVIAWAAWVLHPRVFAHGRLSTIDMTMTAFWFASAWAFFRACESRRGAWRFGPLWGLAIMSKFTALLVAPACALWALLYRRSTAWKIAAWALALTPLAMTAVHPGWWPNPAKGFADAVEVHRHRHETQMVPTYYLGQVYDHALPWHNTLVLTACCTPPAWTALAAVGLVAFSFGGFRQPVVGWIVCNWATMMLVRALPISPGHDGIRQFLPCFPFLALLAGFGFWTLTRRLTNPFAWMLAAAAVGSGIYAETRIRGAELSYYSEAVGGLPGAQALGLETSYWWEAVSPEFLAELNAKLPPNARVGLSSHFMHSFEVYQRWGLVRGDVQFLGLEKWAAGPPERMPEFLLVIDREGMLRRRDKPMFARALAMLEASLRGPAIAMVEREGVRLIVLARREE